jgi:hypothetical protein
MAEKDSRLARAGVSGYNKPKSRQATVDQEGIGGKKKAPPTRELTGL